jgi:hypothetical protein
MGQRLHDPSVALTAVEAARHITAEALRQNDKKHQRD